MSAASPVAMAHPPAASSTRSSPHTPPNGDMIDEAVAKDERNARSTSSADTTARDLGFSLCHPDYIGGLLPGAHDHTEVDIIGVAAIGADSVTSWAMPSQSPTKMWITFELRKRIPKARVLLYSGLENPKETDGLLSLAKDLLNALHNLREHDGHRPFYFVCHSTGGLVAKLALNTASRGDEKHKQLLADCYGISFFATPHQGSTYLSLDEFSLSVSENMVLKAPLFPALRAQLQVQKKEHKDGLLQVMNSDFKRLALDLKVWTFYETEDSDLSFPSPDGTANPIRAPIVSIKSAILDIYHEVDFPLLTNHIGCASFAKPNEHTLKDYLLELQLAVNKARELAKVDHHDLNLKNKVDVEVSGFYQGLSPDEESDAPILLWSIQKTLAEFDILGPNKCLQERLKEVSGPAPPQVSQISKNTRATSWMVDPTSNERDPDNDPLKEAANIPEILTGMDTQSAVKGGDAPKEARKSRRHGLGASNLIDEATTAIRSKSSARFLRRESSSTVSKLESKPVFEARPKEAIPDVKVSTPVDEHVKETNDPGGTAPGSSSEDYFSQIPGARSFTHLDQLIINPSRTIGSPALLSPKIEIHNTPFPQYDKARGRTGSLNVINPPPTRVMKPDASSRKLVWIHVPFNNPIWVNDVLTRISHEKDGKLHHQLLDPKHWASKHVRTHRSRHHSCFVKHGCSVVPPDQHHRTPASSPDIPSTASGLRFNAHISLFLPYLHWDTYKFLLRRGNLVKNRISHGRSRPVPIEVARMGLEHRVTWDYLGHDPPFHSRRTLDQFRYPNLHDTRPRDDDQMLYKRTKLRYRLSRADLEDSQYRAGTNSAQNGQFGDDDETQSTMGEKFAEQKTINGVLNGTVLMVDQLWLWVVDDTVVTFFPRRESHPTEGKLHQQADLRNSIYNEVNGDLGHRCENPLDLAALVVLHAVTVLLEGASHRDLEVIRIFEESIIILTEALTKSFKEFRTEGFQDRSGDYDSDDPSTTIKARHAAEAKKAAKQYRNDTSAMLELRDILDELESLRKLLEQQEESIGGMVAIYNKPTFKESGANGKSILEEAQEKLKGYISHVEQLKKSAEKTREDFEKLLLLKQRQANVDEVRLARYQADIASGQSRSVLIFTVFTVIFLPLTFFTGLFGMNVNEWSGVPTNVPWRVVVEVSIPLSCLIIICALALARSPRVRKIARSITANIPTLLVRFYRLLRRAWVRIRIPYVHRQPNNITAMIRQKRKPLIKEKKRELRNAKRATKLKRTNSGNDDFWAEHEPDMAPPYTIPTQNLRSHL